ncbi:hypothetical protein K504DRAFT_496145 [Pleomassaria siparia CBS 279.74]|uniref:CUE domain-containing protein n=1 Tax=Pleomassaria siparia CBS 279.74 TaxID=1314801 RepID=A0A6G1JQ64_9PLEO|nr:hypothetical protein K504DRAFT_496145 [Pleomassaria siparia CBS 279.74]
MSTPVFAPFPQANVRRSVLPQEWQLYLDSWTSLAELYLRLSDKRFSSAVAGSDSLTQFLISFFHELANDDSIALEVATLRKKCFLLIHRIYSEEQVPVSVLDWRLLSEVGHAFPKSEKFRALIQDLWKRKGGILEHNLQTVKSSLINHLESKRPEDADSILQKVAPLLKISPDVGSFLLTGSDFLDALSAAYPKVSSTMQKRLVAVAYIGLVSLLEGPKPNYSLLSDHLYSLKHSGEKDQNADPTKKMFIADLVTNTPLMSKIHDGVTTPEGARVKNIAASLTIFRQSTIARPKKLIRRKVDKGKGRAPDGEYDHGALGEVHIHRMSLVSQIQDLFPDLGSAFVVKLLDAYNENIEEVTGHLLEGSLLPHLANANRSEQLYVNTLFPQRPDTSSAPESHLIPRSTPPPQHRPLPERRNKFDNDEFDRLTVDASRLHVGRKNQGLTADSILSDRSSAPKKSAILSALAAFDSDDDERDDTYDVEDVGGTVDSAFGDEANADLGHKNEETLFKAYSATPELFSRDAETRRGKPRTALKAETGMTDEAIEGWGIMVGRDPKRLRRLEAKFSTFGGQQRELASTAYRESPADSGAEADAGSGNGHRGGRGGGPGRGRGRGRGRGGGGRGGNVAGPSDDKATQLARRRKEANKGNNRQAGRAKKMARGGFPPAG